jgi:long-subunit acyl-CoA synthetase (AMP-forming)
VTTTTAAESVRPRALGASTLCEAFQITAAEHPDRVALRTLGDAMTLTFGEYAERVRAFAHGLHALGVRRGDTVGLMLINRPEFHLLDAAAMHLGATAFSIYNTSPAEQIAYLLDDAANRVLIVQAEFVERARHAVSGQAPWSI